MLRSLAVLLLFLPSVSQASIKFATLPAPSKTQTSAEAVPTPYSEVVRVLGLLPRPEVGFVDFGCGPEARWCIAAAERWKCKVTGIEIDASRATAARRRVKEAGLDNLITIINADAIATDVQADVGVAFLYHDTLQQLKPRIERLRAFASYMHQPPVASVKNGDAWIYTKPAPGPRMANWGGQLYAGPVCDNPNCGMCNSIRAQLSAIAPMESTANAPRGHYETKKFKFCNGRSCWFEDRQVWVPEQ